MSIEGGYDAYQNTNSKAVRDLGPDHFKLYGYDLNVKFILPLLCGIDLFSTVGAHYLKQDALNIRFSNSDAVYESRESKTLPSVGFGIVYNFNSHVAIRISWIHILGSGEIDNINFLPAGIVLSL